VWVVPVCEQTSEEVADEQAGKDHRPQYRKFHVADAKLVSKRLAEHRDHHYLHPESSTVEGSDFRGGGLGSYSSAFKVEHSGLPRHHEQFKVQGRLPPSPSYREEVIAASGSVPDRADSGWFHVPLAWTAHVPSQCSSAHIPAALAAPAALSVGLGLEDLFVLGDLPVGDGHERGDGEDLELVGPDAAGIYVLLDGRWTGGGLHRSPVSSPTSNEAEITVRCDSYVLRCFVCSC